MEGWNVRSGDDRDPLKTTAAAEIIIIWSGFRAFMHDAILFFFLVVVVVDVVVVSVWLGFDTDT